MTIDMEKQNANLLEAQESALVEIKRIMHACFISGAYQGRMEDIGGTAYKAMKILSKSIKEARES